VIRNPHLILLKDQVKEDEMGGVCGTYEGNNSVFGLCLTDAKAVIR
jgi:hypothetical protein